MNDPLDPQINWLSYIKKLFSAFSRIATCTTLVKIQIPH